MPKFTYKPQGHNAPGVRPDIGEVIPGRSVTVDDPAIVAGLRADDDFQEVKPRAKTAGKTRPAQRRKT
jgi:hypothetical protein